MSEETFVLVCGMGETASAVARRLFAEGRSVAIHQATPPRTLRRRMTFSDAWFDGAATLDGVEARRADLPNEFLLGLRSRQFIPVLVQPFANIVGRWPWDVIVVTSEEVSPAVDLKSLAELTVGVGTGFDAGVDCDIVIETEGLDPGAIRRAGSALPRGPIRPDRASGRRCCIPAPTSGLFRPTNIIGGFVERGEALGAVGDTVVEAPISGRISGIVRKGQAVIERSTIAEIAISNGAQVAGVSTRNQAISRGAAFAVEMESGGWGMVSFDDWLS